MSADYFFIFFTCWKSAI